MAKRYVANDIEIPIDGEEEEFAAQFPKVEYDQGNSRLSSEEKEALEEAIRALYPSVDLDDPAMQEEIEKLLATIVEEDVPDEEILPEGPTLDLEAELSKLTPEERADLLKRVDQRADSLEFDDDMNVVEKKRPGEGNKLAKIIGRLKF